MYIYLYGGKPKYYAQTQYYLRGGRTLLDTTPETPRPITRYWYLRGGRTLPHISVTPEPPARSPSTYAAVGPCHILRPKPPPYHPVPTRR